MRYGVAPDHEKIKSITLALRKVLETDGIRFLGNVEVGKDVSMEELHEHYDAIVVAYGAAIDRRLDIEGEDLPGSFSATDFVAWYSGHPDTQIDRFTLDATDVVVVGVGNVAVDVARILAKTADDLRPTDLPDHVLEVLARQPRHRHPRARPARSGAGEVHHQGAARARRAGERRHRRRPRRTGRSTRRARRPSRPTRTSGATWRSCAAGRTSGRPASRAESTCGSCCARRRCSAPTRSTGVEVERTVLDGTGNVRGTGCWRPSRRRWCCAASATAVQGLAGLPFNERNGTDPARGRPRLHEASRCRASTSPAGSSADRPGVIGTNKSDASETISSLIADAPNLPRAPIRDPEALVTLLAERGVDVVDWEGWVGIDEAEIALGKSQGRDRIKIADRELLLGHASRR